MRWKTSFLSSATEMQKPQTSKATKKGGYGALKRSKGKGQDDESGDVDTERALVESDAHEQDINESANLC
jgi:hypothetical protein